MTSRHIERATAAALALQGLFQAALAAGAPWGRAAYGGKHPDALPPQLRAISGVAALGYGTGAILVVCETGNAPVRARAFTTLSALMAIGTIANGASRSPVERAVWTPLTAVTTVLAWRSRPVSH